MRFFWQDYTELPRRAVRLEQQVFLLTVRVKELTDDRDYLMSQVRGLQDREKTLAAIEESVRRAASQTTVAVSNLYTEVSLFRRGVGDWVPQVGSEAGEEEHESREA